LTAKRSSKPSALVCRQDVEPLMIRPHGFRKLPGAGERRQVGLVEYRLAPPLPLDLFDQSLRPLAVAAMDQHRGAGRGEFCRDITADAIG
jgi:hypothetical protein